MSKCQKDKSSKDISLTEQTARTHISDVVLSYSTVSVASGQACCGFEDGILIWSFVLLLLLSTSKNGVQFCRITYLTSKTHTLCKGKVHPKIKSCRFTHPQRSRKVTFLFSRILGSVPPKMKIMF